MPLVNTIVICLMMCFMWSLPAWAQHGRGSGGPFNGSPIGNNRTHGGGHGQGPANQTGALPPAGGNNTAAQPAAPYRAQGGSLYVRPLSPPPAAAFQPGFSTNLGNTVGGFGFSSGWATPGMGNINQPGLPPGAPTAVPNINRPGLAPGGQVRGYGPYGSGGPRHGQYHRRSQVYPNFVGVGPMTYGVPYYVPYYYVPDTGYVTGSPSAPASDSYAPIPQYAESAPPAPATVPYSFEMEPETPKQSAPAPAPAPVTLLAFKDHTIVAVTEYWLEGYTIYYATSYGGQIGIPLAQLDLPLTQQLNRERNLRFVLESRP